LVSAKSLAVFRGSQDVVPATEGVGAVAVPPGVHTVVEAAVQAVLNPLNLYVMISWGTIMGNPVFAGIGGMGGRLGGGGDFGGGEASCKVKVKFVSTLGPD
jgi:hypothetical protein